MQPRSASSQPGEGHTTYHKQHKHHSEAQTLQAPAAPIWFIHHVSSTPVAHKCDSVIQGAPLHSFKLCGLHEDGKRQSRRGGRGGGVRYHMRCGGEGEREKGVIGWGDQEEGQRGDNEARVSSGVPGMGRGGQYYVKLYCRGGGVWTKGRGGMDRWVIIT